MHAAIIKLSFREPVHFGRGRLTDSAFACDAGTLFSALFTEALQMGCHEQLFAAAKSGALALSDAFPFIGNVLYLPKPMVPSQAQDKVEQRDSREKKAHKKLGYIPAGQLAGYLDGNFDAIGELDHFRHELGRAGAQTKVNASYDPSGESKPYQVGAFSFRPQSGLYFIARGDYDLRPVLDQLQFAGIGGERTSGYGRFSYGIETQSPLLAAIDRQQGGRRVLLSSAAPTREELTDGLLDGSHYKLVRKGGFVQSQTFASTPQKKRDLYLFAAGSTFTTTFDGAVFDVNATAGSHPVYRYARAMWMGV